MAEQKANEKNTESGQRTGKRFWYVAIAILTVAISCYFLSKAGLWEFQTVDEQLAAIEAAGAIPDEENAAIIYNQLLQDPNATSLLDYRPGFLNDDLDYLTSREPWLSKDYPELAEWLKDRQDTISKLLQASKKEKCRFPIIADYQQMDAQVSRLSAMRRWAFLLLRAANNDIAEGRINAGIQKNRCIIQMGKHLCQQPVLVEYMVGIAFEGLALGSMKTFILEGDVSEKHLKTIEASIPQSKDNWTEVSSKIIEFETLFERKNVSLYDRVRYWRFLRQFGSMQDTFDHIHTIYLRLLADRRGNRILIALRRYKNKNDRWPQTLSEIQSFVPAEILIDPYNNGSFVYKLTEENFTLYSRGKNNIDEGGKRKGGPDDWLIWPRGSRKTKEKKADDK